MTELESNEVLWSSALHDLSMVMPSDAFLTSFTGQITLGPTGWETQVGPTGLIGNIQFSGTALDYQNVALWLDRMDEVDGWENAWVTSATQSAGAPTGGASGGAPATVGVQYIGSVDLSTAAAQDGTAP